MEKPYSHAELERRIRTLVGALTTTGRNKTE